MSLRGKWIGQYIYGEGYSAKHIGRVISFEMNLIAKGIEFYGNFSDDETRSVFENNGKVAGFVEGEYIAFNKQYPKAWLLNENDDVELLDDSIPSPLIKYEGTLINDQYEGAWEIHRYYKEEGTDEIFSIVGGTGTWSMRKLQD